MTNRRDRIEGAMLGLLVGDALGVPYEFHHASTIPPAAKIEMAPPDGFDRAHCGVPPGTWSDDGAQALCLLASLLQCDRFDENDFGRRLVNWYDWGYLAVDSVVFDVGIQSANAIQRLREGVPASEAGGTGVSANGNGSLMRVLPTALWHKGHDVDVSRDAALQSRVTHGHPRSQGVCALYALWICRIVHGVPLPWKSALEGFRSLHPQTDVLRSEIEAAVRPDDPPVGRGSGYVVDCFNTARIESRCGDFETALREAIALGDDTDTTCAVLGGVMGARLGVDAIPKRWRDALRGRELCDPLIRALCERA